MSLPFDLTRIRAYELEFGAGGQRLGCKFARRSRHKTLKMKQR
jgi:hypothetical protein